MPIEQTLTGPPRALVLSPPRAADAGPTEAFDPARRAALERLVREHHAFVWRSAQRMGVPDADVEDVVQDVFLRAQAKFDEIRHERAFLFQTCIFVIGHLHRRAHRRREVADEKRIKSEVDARATPEDDAVEAEARIALQRILDIMPDDLRAVFVLFELECLTTPEIAELVGAPVGTVASRLRRARELFAGYAQAYERGSR